MNRNITISSILLLCAGAGFLSGRMLMNDTSSSKDFAEHATDLNGKNLTTSAADATRQRDLSTTRRQAENQSTHISDLISSAHALLDHPDAVERARAWQEFIMILSPDECETLLDNMRDCGIFLDDSLEGPISDSNSLDWDDDKALEYRLLLAVWAKTDPVGALRYSLENSKSLIINKVASDTTVAIILSTWATYDSEAALQWIKSHPDNQIRNAWISGLIDGVASTDLDRATLLLDSMDNPGKYPEAMQKLVRHAAHLEPEAAREWAMSLRDDLLRTHAITGIASKIGGTDPKGFADLLVANPSEMAVSSMKNVMWQMAQHDPEAAVSYLTSMTEQSLMSAAFEGVVSGKGFKDTRTALAYLQANRDFVTDDICRDLMWQSLKSEPVLGVESIAMMKDETGQRMAYAAYFDSWLSDHYENAVKWRNENSLPDDTAALFDAIAKRVTEQKK
jgi:hypothetical protein